MYEPERGDWRTFSTLEEFRAATGQEQHGLELDFGIFERDDPAGPFEAARGLSRHGSELPLEAGQQGRGRGRSDPDGQ